MITKTERIRNGSKFPECESFGRSEAIAIEWKPPTEKIPKEWHGYILWYLEDEEGHHYYELELPDEWMPTMDLKVLAWSKVTPPE